ncbi:conserved hypothetical protein [Hyella patelloides LEGE 07179]|uniref:Uncharacterized protein n=1 Tax=Hyella patelloides LEGE 07179 TaxID=945734 RepID=A0A563W0L7_9CYAN|nr:hypothetical protein [Hyella patelloides]VEP17073.1 conserved hypothetical protein [Hyella patelloides LEGE 07179]
MTNKDFFLDPDEAQTLGNINYMRKSTRVRHTFPKNLKNPNGFEVVKEISSLDGNSKNNFQQSSPESSFSSPKSQPTQFKSSVSDSSPKSTPSSSNMDLFRNMARNIGKR